MWQSAAKQQTATVCVTQFYHNLPHTEPIPQKCHEITTVVNIEIERPTHWRRNAKSARLTSNFLLSWNGSLLNTNGECHWFLRQFNFLWIYWRLETGGVPCFASSYWHEYVFFSTSAEDLFLLVCFHFPSFKMTLHLISFQQVPFFIIPKTNLLSQNNPMILHKVPECVLFTQLVAGNSCNISSFLKNFWTV